jgi:hypothetical protein
MSAVKKMIPLTIIIVVVFVLLSNYVLLPNLSFGLPNLFMYMIYGLLVFIPYGYYISTQASSNKCNKTNKSGAIVDGFKAYFYAIGSYLLVYFLTFLKSPFSEIFGNNIKADCIAEIFYISLNLIICVIMISFNSAEKNCKVNIEIIEKNVKKLDVYLNKREKKKKVPTILVKD